MTTGELERCALPEPLRSVAQAFCNACKNGAVETMGGTAVVLPPHRSRDPLLGKGANWFHRVVEGSHSYGCSASQLYELNSRAAVATPAAESDNLTLSPLGHALSSITSPMAQTSEVKAVWVEFWKLNAALNASPVVATPPVDAEKRWDVTHSQNPAAFCLACNEHPCKLIVATPSLPSAPTDTGALRRAICNVVHKHCEGIQLPHGINGLEDDLVNALTPLPSAVAPTENTVISNHVFTCSACARQWTVDSNDSLECFFVGLCYWCICEHEVTKEEIDKSLRLLTK